VYDIIANNTACNSGRYSRLKCTGWGADRRRFWEHFGNKTYVSRERRSVRVSCANRTVHERRSTASAAGDHSGGRRRPRARIGRVGGDTITVVIVSLLYYYCYITTVVVGAAAVVECVQFNNNNNDICFGFRIDLDRWTGAADKVRGSELR